MMNQDIYIIVHRPSNECFYLFLQIADLHASFIYLFLHLNLAARGGLQLGDLLATLANDEADHPVGDFVLFGDHAGGGARGAVAAGHAPSSGGVTHG